MEVAAREDRQRDEMEDIENEEVLRSEFDTKRIPPWQQQLTLRGVIAGCIIGIVYSIIIMKLDLTTGLSPNLNVAAALLAFIFLVNLSLLFGAVISWGIMWPLIGKLQGHWFPADIPKSSMQSLNGYKVFVSIALILGDGLYVFIKVVLIVLLSPVLSFANAYGAGLTDQNMAYNYGKVAIFILASLAGKENGVVAGLVGCGIIKMVAFVGCTLMQDFKTGHLTYSAPRAMILGQAIGTVIGCISASLSFMLYYNAFDIGNPTGEYKAPYAVVYRNIAILGVQGFSALPHNCLQLCYGFFGFAVVANLMKDLLPSKIGKWIPLPMVMAVPFLVGGYFAIDMCVGSLVILLLNRIDRKRAEWLLPVIASGLICGEGIWSLPAAFLALAKVRPPMCMSFASS